MVLNIMAKKIQGANIAGGNPSRGRVENDFYATPTEATEALFNVETFEGNVYEPACGDGAMSKIIEKYNHCYSSDLCDRGYGQPNTDFLNTNWTTVENVITNPPFNLFQEFAEKAIELSKNKVALFGKLQALEGQKRATFLEKSPLKAVYVFKKRITPMRNGKDTDENGKKWASTMAFAWYVWEKGYTGEPIIKWI